MNKFAKYSLKKLNEQNFPERKSYINLTYNSMEYQKSLRKQRNGVNCEDDAFFFAMKHVVELNTVNGLAKCYASKGIDRLVIADVQLPIPEFYFSESGNCYRPGFKTYELNQVLFGYHYKHFKKNVVKKWAEIKGYLLQTVLKKSSKLMKPILVIDDGDHVYFLHDQKRGEIKIGVSNQVNTRFRSIHTTSGRENLQVIKIIDLGGYELEAALHEYFGKHRIWPREEWFLDHPDIHALIEKLDAGADPWELINASPEANPQEEQEVA